MIKEFSRVLITDQEGKVLVVKDPKKGWVFPGGKQEVGETPEMCAIREIKEEVNLTISNLTKIYEGPLEFEGVQWLGHFYFAKKAVGIPRSNEPDKIKQVVFLKDYEEKTFSKGLAPFFAYLSTEKSLKKQVTIWK